MEQYREILEEAARRELQIAVFWSVILVLLIGAVWVCWYFGFRKTKTKVCRSEKKIAQQRKILQQSTWAAVVLTGICVVIGAIVWRSAVEVRRDIRCDLQQEAYETYAGVYNIEDASTLSKYKLYSRWTRVDFADGECAFLYVDSPLQWLQTDYGTFEGVVVYGCNSMIVVDMSG